jgi:electron transport complex protein RnfG
MLRRFLPVLYITLVVLIAVTLLSYTESITRAQIEARQHERIQALLFELFPEMSNFFFEDDLYTIFDDSIEIGYAFLATGVGYAGDIDILVGLEDANTLRGVTIVSHLETPGLGDKITESAFTDQFHGLDVDGVALRKDGGQVDAITGATISSQAVVDAVREAATERVKELR